MKATTLSTSFFSQLTQKRLFAAQIADLAVRIAEQAGETVTRPLSLAQLERAFEANRAESAIVMDLVLVWAGEMKAHGLLSADDVYDAE